MNQNKNVIWIAAIGVAIVLLVAFLLSKKPADSGPPSLVTPSSAPAFPDGTPPLAPAVPVLPPEAAPSPAPVEPTPVEPKPVEPAPSPPTTPEP